MKLQMQGQGPPHGLSPGVPFIPPQCSTTLPTNEDGTDQQGMYYLLEDRSSGQFYLTNSLSYISQDGAHQEVVPGLESGSGAPQLAILGLEHGSSAGQIAEPEHQHVLASTQIAMLGLQQGSAESQRTAPQTQTQSTPHRLDATQSLSYQTTDKTMPPMTNTQRQTPLRNNLSSPQGILQYLSGGCREIEVTEETFHDEYSADTDHQGNFTNSLESQFGENVPNLSDLIQEQALNDDVDNLYTKLKEVGFVTSPTKHPKPAQPEARVASSSGVVNKTKNLKNGRLLLPNNTWINSPMTDDSDGLVIASSPSSVPEACDTSDSISTGMTPSNDPISHTSPQAGPRKPQGYITQSKVTADAQSTSKNRSLKHNNNRQKRFNRKKGYADNSKAVQCDMKEVHVNQSIVQHSKPSQYYTKSVYSDLVPSNMKQLSFGAITVYTFLRQQVPWCSLAELIQRKLFPISIFRLKTLIHRCDEKVSYLTAKEFDILKKIQLLFMQTKNTILLSSTGVARIARELLKKGYESEGLSNLAHGKIVLRDLSKDNKNPVSKKLAWIINKQATKQVKDGRDFSNSSSSCKSKSPYKRPVSAASKTVQTCKTVLQTEHALPPGKFNITDSRPLMDYFRSVGIIPSSCVTPVIHVKNKPTVGKCKMSLPVHNTASSNHAQPDRDSPDSTSVSGGVKPNCDILQSAVDQVFGEELSMVSSSLDPVATQSSYSSSTKNSPVEREMISSSSDSSSHSCIKLPLKSAPPAVSCFDFLENHRAKDIPESMSVFPTKLPDGKASTKLQEKAQPVNREMSKNTTVCNKEPSHDTGFHTKLYGLLCKPEEKVVVLRTELCEGITSLLGGNDFPEPVGSKLNAPIISNIHQSDREPVRSKINVYVTDTDQTAHERESASGKSKAYLTNTQQFMNERESVCIQPKVHLINTHETVHESHQVSSKIKASLIDASQFLSEKEPVTHQSRREGVQVTDSSTESNDNEFSESPPVDSVKGVSERPYEAQVLQTSSDLHHYEIVCPPSIQMKSTESEDLTSTSDWEHGSSEEHMDLDGGEDPTSTCHISEAEVAEQKTIVSALSMQSQIVQQKTKAKCMNISSVQKHISNEDSFFVHNKVLANDHEITLNALGINEQPKGELGRVLEIYSPSEDIQKIVEDDRVELLSEIKGPCDNSEYDVTESASSSATFAQEDSVSVGDALSRSPTKLDVNFNHDSSVSTNCQNESNERSDTLSKLLLKMEMLDNCDSPSGPLHVLAEAAEVVHEIMNKGLTDRTSIPAESITKEGIVRAVENYWRPYLPHQVLVHGGQIQIELVLEKKTGVSPGKKVLRFISGVFGQMIMRGVKEGKIAIAKHNDSLCQSPETSFIPTKASSMQKDETEKKAPNMCEKPVESTLKEATNQSAICINKVLCTKTSQGVCPETAVCFNEEICPETAVCFNEEVCPETTVCFNEEVCPETAVCFNEEVCPETAVCFNEEVCPKTAVCFNEGVCPETAVSFNEGLCPETAVCFNEEVCPKTVCINEEVCPKTVCFNEGVCPETAVSFNEGLCPETAVSFNKGLCPETAVSFNEGVCLETTVCFNEGVCPETAVSFNEGVCPETAVCFNEGVCPETAVSFNEGVCPETAVCFNEGVCPGTAVSFTEGVCLKTTTDCNSKRICPKALIQSNNKVISQERPTLNVRSEIETGCTNEKVCKPKKVYTRKRKLQPESKCKSMCMLGNLETDCGDRCDNKTADNRDNQVNSNSKWTKRKIKKPPDLFNSVQPMNVSTETKIESVLVEVNNTTVAQIIDLSPSLLHGENSARKSHKLKQGNVKSTNKQTISASDAESRVYLNPRKEEFPSKISLDKVINSAKQAKVASKSSTEKFSTKRKQVPIDLIVKKSDGVKTSTKLLTGKYSENVLNDKADSVYNFTDTESSDINLRPLGRSWVSIDEDISVKVAMPQRITGRGVRKAIRRAISSSSGN